MKLIALFAICLAAGPAAAAENGGKTLVDDLVKHWQASKKLALDVAGVMPADAYRPFKPSDTAWSFADDIGGAALLNVLACSLATHTKAPQPFQSAMDHPMDHSKAGTIEALTVAYDYCIAGLSTMDDRALLEMATYAGHPAMKLDIYWNALAHATHRLGEADLYLREKNIKPPDTGPQYQF